MKATNFSRWTRWNERDQLQGIQSPGIYAIAISRDDLAESRFSWSEFIVYFGMTNAVAGLKGRLKQFDNTIMGKSGHGGADRFLTDHPKYRTLTKVLYVAVAPFVCDVTSNSPKDLLTMGEVAKAEYECFAKYAALWGNLPKYNDKKISPKHYQNQS